MVENTNRHPCLREDDGLQCDSPFCDTLEGEDDDWQWSLMPTDAPENGNNYMPDCLECANRLDCQATG